LRAAWGGGLHGLVFGPIGILYVVFLLLPIGYFLILSVFTYSPMEMFIPGFTLENYNRFLGDSYYQGVLLATFRIALITTLCSLLAAYPLAYFLARYPTRWRGVLLFLVIAPLMSGVIVRTYAWIVILGEYGAVNRSAQWIGLIDGPLKLLNTEFAVIVALVHILLPFMVFPLFSAIAGQDPDLARAAGTLGARPLRTFCEVTLPLSRQGILMGSVLVFTLSAGAVVTPSLMGGKDVQTIGMNIYELVTSTLNWPLASAFAMTLVLCQFVIIFLYTRGGRDASQEA